MSVRTLIHARKRLGGGKRIAARMLAPYCGVGDEAVQKAAAQGFEEDERVEFAKCQLGYADRDQKQFKKSWRREVRTVRSEWLLA